SAPPRHFGCELREKLVSKLMKDVEGTCSGRHGFVVVITEEILEATVTMVNMVIPELFIFIFVFDENVA
nr:DNA-directed RNA polymerase II subunit RPB7 [Tanacetum cinerariifolium]